MKERSRPTDERSGHSTRAITRSAKVTPSASAPHQTKGIPYRQQRLLLGLGVIGTAIFLFALAWVIRSTTLPELVPILDLPTPSPVPTQVAALAPSSTPTLIAPQPTEPSNVLSVALTPAPDGERRPTAHPRTTAVSGPSTVYLPQLSFVIVSTPTALPQAFVIAPPVQSWPESLPGLTASKLGLNVVSNSDPDIMEFVRRAHPRVIMAVDEVGWLAEVKAASSATITVARFTSAAGQNADWPATLDPEIAAEMYINQWLANYRRNSSVDYWEGWSDFQTQTETDWHWYAQFEAARACQMRDLGLRAAVGGFSIEALSDDVMAWFLPALEAAQKCDSLITLHVYNAPTLACDSGSNTSEAPPLRYRAWYEKYLRPAGLGELQLVISELGIRGPSTNCGDPGNLTQGWKSYTGWWVSQGFGADGIQTYLSMLTWYDSEIQADAYVTGAAIFAAGASSLNPSKQTFDVHDLINPLTYYAVKQLPSVMPATGYP